MSMQADEPIALADMMLRRATKSDQQIALAFVAVFVVFTVAASRFGDVHGPIVRPFVTIVATLWGGADLLTAFLLFTQFSVNGVRLFASLGAAYAFSGLLTIPYIAFFPGIFLATPVSIATEQISVLLWFCWHIVFPSAVIAYRLYDWDFSRRYLSGARIRIGLRTAFACVAGGALLAVGLFFISRGRLPYVIVGGEFTSTWSHVFAPLVFVVNAAAAMLLVGFARKQSLLQLWLAVALATAALDGALNAFAGARFTASWYLGKAETLATSCVLLLMLLSQVGALYRQLGTMAIIDPLTGLRNRRSFDEYLRWTLARRVKTEIAFLLLDIDFFKQYNDRYGHAAGDRCLQRIADALRGSLLRSVDLSARYGGEEFVVLLPETTAAGGREVAERIRLRVEALAIPHAGSTVGPVVTLSVGVAHADRSDTTDGDQLFSLADRALYDAKVRRNTTVVAASIAAGARALPEIRLPTAI